MKNIPSYLLHKRSVVVFNYYSRLSIVVLILLLPITLCAEGEWNQLNLANSPEARAGHSMVVLSDGRVITFGGYNNAGDVFDDLHVLHNNEWDQINPGGDPPEARVGHSMVESPDESFSIFGGENESGDALSDHWKNHLLDGTWDRLFPANDPPPARAWHAASTLWMTAGWSLWAARVKHTRISMICGCTTLIQTLGIG